HETFRKEDPDVTDQSYPPFVLTGDDGEPNGRIVAGDAVLCFNYRGDRVIEISRAFEEGPEFQAFDRGPGWREGPPDVRYAGMMEYDGDLHIPKHFLVEPPVIEQTSG